MTRAWVSACDRRILGYGTKEEDVTGPINSRSDDLVVDEKKDGGSM